MTVDKIDLAEYRTALANQEPLSPQAYQRVNATAEGIHLILSLALQRSSLMDYLTSPHAVAAFPQLGTASPAAEAVSKRPAPAGAAARAAPTRPALQRAEHPAPHPPANDLNTVAKIQGFLKWSGEGFPPNCAVTMKLPTMASAECLCIRFCAQGTYCGFARRCNYAHPTTFTQIPRASQEAFQTYVSQTSGLAFIIGQGPPGTQ
jgi:hypothetical protein